VLVRTPVRRVVVAISRDFGTDEVMKSLYISPIQVCAGGIRKFCENVKDDQPRTKLPAGLKHEDIPGILKARKLSSA